MEASLEELTESYPETAFEAASKCPICGGESVVGFKAANIHPQKPRKFDFRRCRECRHGWIDPMPTQGLLNHLYGAGSSTVIGEWKEAAMTEPEQRCMKTELGGKGGSYLELGVGQGSLYQKFLEHGWQCVGIDPGDWASRFPGVYRTVEAVPVDFRADVVAAFDVLEHVSDPVAVLKQLRVFAKPGTRLYCAMPNVQSARAFWGKGDWRMARPLGHVNYYSAKSIRQAMKLAGFAVTSLEATDYTVPHVPRGIRDGIQVAVEVFGFGDQWLVTAEAKADGSQVP